MTTVRLGTRGSALAVTQSRWVARALEVAARSADLDLTVELVEVRTRGDVDPTALASLGGVGVFATALRKALAAGECDLAVHSYKDLPTAPTPGLSVAAVPAREDPRDVLCVRPQLLPGQQAGASSGQADPASGQAGADAGQAGASTALTPAASPSQPAGQAQPDSTTEHALASVAGAPAGGLASGPTTDPAGALDLLPRGARVGTGSPRRWAQLLALRPDLEIVPIRGNVPTRLSRVVGGGVGADGPMGQLAPGREADLDAVVLAHAGMRRLGLEQYASLVLGAELMLPAAAQGALAVEVREDVNASLPPLAAALALVDDPLTRACADAERALMRELGAGCAAPVGVLATPITRGDADATGAAATQAHVLLDAVVVSLDGSQSRRVSLTGPADDAAGLGRDAAERLLAAGAGEITDLHATKGGNTRA